MAGEGTPVRSIIASFTVEVDRAGALARGHQQVDALKAKFQQLDATAKQVSKSTSASTAGLFARATAAYNARLAQPGGIPASPSAPGRLPADPRIGFLGRLRGAASSATPVVARLGSVVGGLASGAGAAALGIGAVGVAAALALRKVTALVDEMGGIGEEAAKLGVGNAEFQRLSVLAAQNATSVSALSTAFRTLATAAVDPTKETAAAFRQLGVETKNADGTFRSRQDLFFETAGALADIEDGTVRAALAQKIYGRSSRELAPLLAGGRAGLEAQRESLDKLPIVPDSAIEAADRLSDRWATFNQEFLGRAAPIIEETFIPALESATEWILKVGAAIGDWLKDSHIVDLIGRSLTNVFSLIRVPIQSLGKFFDRLGGKDSSAVTKITNLLGRFAVALTTVIGLPALLAEDYQYYLDGKDSVIGRALNGLSLGFADAFEAIKNSAASALEWILQKALSVAVAVKDAVTPDFVKRFGPGSVDFTAGTMPVPGVPLPTTNPDERQGVTTVQDNSTKSVVVQVQTNASPAQIGKAVSTALDGGTNRLISGYP